MGLTERHWFENEDVPENYEWDLEDAMYNSRTNKKHDDDIVRCKDCRRKETYDCPIYSGAFCLFCPYQSNRNESCMTQMYKNALSLIREQQEEIQRLYDALKPEPPKEDGDVER